MATQYLTCPSAWSPAGPRVSPLKMSTLLLLASLLVGVLPLRAAPSEVPRVPFVSIPSLKQAPKIDGVIDPKEWFGAAEMTGICMHSQKDPARLSPLEVTFRVAFAERSIFFAMSSAVPPGGKLVARGPKSPRGDNSRVFKDDHVEIIIDPNRSTNSASRRILQCLFNSRGATYRQAYRLDGGGEQWLPNLVVGNTVSDGMWHFETKLDFDVLGLTESDLAEGFGFRVCRSWQQIHGHPTQTEWSPLGGAFTSVETMPVVKRVSSGPSGGISRVSAVSNLGQPLEIELATANTTAFPQIVDYTIELHPERSKPEMRKGTLQIAPGSLGTETVSQSGLDPEETVRVRTTVTDRQTGQPIYIRDFNVLYARADDVWALDSEPERKVNVSFAYYPSIDRLHASVSYTALEARSRVTGCLAKVQRGNEVILEQQLKPSGDSVFESTLELPPLPDGKYELVVETQGVAVHPIREPFERTRFPWEGTALGRSDILVEPFTPITMGEGYVTTLLRRYSEGGLGLWSQVESLNEDLLAAPMELKIFAEGKVFEARNDSVKTDIQTDTRRVQSGTWTGGPLSGSFQTTLDFDGMLRWKLKLNPHEGVPVDRVTLVIPLKGSQVPLMHACTDGIRFNYAGYTPKGEGVIWKGSQAPKNEIVGTFIPYLWLGAEERGFSVFGENDRGWMNGVKDECIEIVRTGDTVEIRLNLITGPAVWKSPREIELGFLVTPVKPMPEGWRLTSLGTPPSSDPQYAGKLRTIAWLGALGYVGAAAHAMDPEPREKDFRIWEKLGDVRKGHGVDQAFFDEWKDGYKGIYAPRRGMPGPGDINYTLNVMKTLPKEVTIYTNARGVRMDTPEAATFMDEWLRQRYTQRKWTPISGFLYDLDPSESYQDRAMWLYDKAKSTFANHIYWDDLFLSANYRAVGGTGYYRDDGEFQPGTGLWNLRGLVRRTAILGMERGEPPFNIGHMTNTAIGPILSFTQMFYTWEDKGGDRDFQDRWSRDYIRAESTGRQFGAVSICLPLVHSSDPAREARAWRTMTGVMLTHELKSNRVVPDFDKTFTHLLRAGYGDKDASVFNYWQKDYPVMIRGGESSSLLVGKPGSALLVLCDYGTAETSEFRIEPDAQRLGLRLPLTVTNLESGEKVPVDSKGGFSIKLPKHEYALIQINGAAR